MNATGCVGFAADAGLILDRVIESLSVDPDAVAPDPKAQIWVDVFLENTRDNAAELALMHWGSLLGETTTKWAWGSPGSVCPIRARIEALHREVETIQLRDEGVYVEGREYLVYDRPDGILAPEIGGVDGQDAPFTLFRVPFPPRQRSVVRFKLRMTEQTFDRQIGPDAEEFYAYGEAILLDRIAEDLLAYTGKDKRRYEESRKEFMSCQALPAVFEYMLVSLPSSKFRWRAAPLTYNFSPQPVPEKFEQTTHWFISRFRHSGNFQLKMENAFLLKVVRELNVLNDL